MSILNKALRFVGGVAAEGFVGSAAHRIGTALGLKVGMKIFPPLVFVLTKEGDGEASTHGVIVDEDNISPQKKRPRKR